MPIRFFPANSNGAYFECDGELEAKKLYDLLVGGTRDQSNTPRASIASPTVLPSGRNKAILDALGKGSTVEEQAKIYGLSREQVQVIVRGSRRSSRKRQIRAASNHDGPGKNGRAAPVPNATTAPPGSAAKLNALSDRAAKGLPLHINGDNREQSHRRDAELVRDRKR
jgi:hypothetical protein